jgi:outer membrane protein assembly factor BamB
MTRRWSLGFLAVLIALLLRSAPVAAAELSQVISREDPNFQIAQSRLAIGRDGRVYLGSSTYVLRMERDGSGRRGSKVTYALTMVAANADGIIATSNAHFNHSINLWDRNFAKLGADSDFLVSDLVQWNAPFDVQAGASGDFYGMDQSRNRIVRVGVPGRTVTTYALAKLGEDLTGKNPQFRVWERGRRFYVLCPTGTVRVIGFDGALMWSVPAGLAVDSGGFDIDGEGRLMILKNTSDVIDVYEADGKPAPPIKLKMAERKGRVTDMRVFANDVIVKRPRASELFQVYDRKTGALRRVVVADVEELKVTLASDVWIAGAPVAMKIRLETPSRRPTSPRWRIWLRPLGVPTFEELALRDGHVIPSTNAGGLYQLRISADVVGDGGEYLVEKIIEIRQPGAKGSLSIFTPLNRRYFGHGESIPVSVLARTSDAADFPTRVQIRLLDGSVVLAECDLHLESGTPTALVLRPALTASLRPGRYLLSANAAGLTIASQWLEIGVGLEESARFTIVQHGDYRAGFPTGTVFDAPEKIAAHLEAARKLGLNMFVDRLGHGGAGVQDLLDRTLTADDWAARFRGDPSGAAPEKAAFEGLVKQSIAAYGASGIEEQAILLSMDAGLPAGTGFDPRKPEQFADSITKVTTSLSSYPAFRGWSWAANWWIGKLGAAAAEGAQEKAAYEAALKNANATGTWDAVLDKVSDRMLEHAVAAERDFRAVLTKVAPRKLSVMTGPYRALGVIPPVTFRNADEIDLQYQAEQIQPPQVTPHNVDFYKRRGKRAWGHPELWNDDGTGGMIFPTIFQMAMRGADGVGWSGEAGLPFGISPPSDPRASGAGALSIYRGLGEVLRDYGPWLTTLRSHDRVAIVVSTRMMRIDGWGKVGGVYFDRLYEAYNACLYAHRPATFVFAEDIASETLKPFRAVLVVGQKVELEPNVAASLKAAREAGAKVLGDATCRPEIASSFARLEISFDQIENDPSAWQDDSAYARIPQYFEKEAATLERVLADVEPVATVDQPGIMLTERASGSGRFVWVVDNLEPELDPGLAWRVGLLISQRLPQVVQVGLHAEGNAVYDMFAQAKVNPASGRVRADLRTLPARLFAILSRPIGGVELHGPRSAHAGQEISWSVSVQNDRGEPIGASLPVRVRLLAGDRTVLSERLLATGATGTVEGHWTVPLNAPAGPLSLEAVELVSGKTAELLLAVTQLPRTADLVGTPPWRAKGLATLLSQSVVGQASTATRAPTEQRFGPHFKDVAVSEENGLAVLNAMNWDDNVYALDLKTGSVKWRQRVGHHFSYGPQSAGSGFAVQGFDLSSAEGYHLYLLDHDGRAERRFALYGLPKRATSWAVGSQLLDRIDNFVTAADGAWVASSGDLGFAVWGRDGKLWWSVDAWRTTREPRLLVAQDRDTLVTMQGATAKAYDARSGKERWKLRLADVGRLLGGAVSADTQTLALRADTYGGRVFVIRKGRLVNAIPTAADDVQLSPDGEFLSVTTGNQLKVYASGGALKWSFTGDSILRGSRISGSGGRIAVGSELGSLYVLDASGKLLWQHDCEALPVAAWLHDGDLLVATWMGTVLRLDDTYRERWRMTPQPTASGIREKLLAPDPTPTTRMEHWGNAASTPAPLSPNLLTQTRALIKATMSDHVQEWQQPIAALTDGKPDAPANPWLAWTKINYVDSGWLGPLVVEIDTFRSQLRVTGITFVEDPAHPESWLRDVRLQVWDARSDKWHDGPDLLSNSATHTHWLEKPIEGARFRLVSTGGGSWPVGNLRLGELVFHGEVLGSSHPDALAKRAVAVLFDEKESDVSVLKTAPFAFRNEDSYSGGKCLALTTAGMVAPVYEPPFGHALPNWDFEIAEHPKPGQYRWLQFAWKSLSPQTTGISLLVGRAWPAGGFSVVAGAGVGPEGVLATKKIATVPTEWTVVRVDLWALYGAKPVRIESLRLGAIGGGAAFDQVLLGRTEDDLVRVGRLAR